MSVTFLRHYDAHHRAAVALHLIDEALIELEAIATGALFDLDYREDSGAQATPYAHIQRLQCRLTRLQMRVMNYQYQERKTS